MRTLLLLVAYGLGVYMGVHMEEQNHALYISKIRNVPYWRVAYRVGKIEGFPWK